MKHENLKYVKVLALIALVIMALDGIYSIDLFTGNSITLEPAALTGSIEIQDEYKYVYQGGKLYYTVFFTNLDSEERKDILVSISVINLQTRKLESYYQETVAVETTISISRDIFISATTPPGIYELQMTINYNGDTAKAADTFEIFAAKVNPYPSQPFDINILIAVSLIVIIGMLTVIFYLEHRHIERGGGRYSKISREV